MRGFAVTLSVLLATGGSHAAPPREDGFDRPSHRPPVEPTRRPEVGRPFPRGSMNLGLVLGFSTGDGTAFSLGAGFGYFVLPGLEPGLELEVTFGSDRPTVTSLLPYLRWVVWRSYSLSPYLKLQGGRWFVSDQTDLSAIGGGGGLIFFVTRYAGLQLEGLVYRLFPSDACGDSCTATNVGLSLQFYFGAPSPPPRRPSRPPDSPAPMDATAPPAAQPEPHEAAPVRDEPVPYR